MSDIRDKYEETIILKGRSFVPSFNLIRQGRERAKKENGVRCPGCGGKIKIEPCIYCEAMA